MPPSKLAPYPATPRETPRCHRGRVCCRLNSLTWCAWVLLPGLVCCSPSEPQPIDTRATGGDPAADASVGAVPDDPVGPSGAPNGAQEGGVDNPCGALSIPASVEVTSDHANVLILFDQSKSMDKMEGGFGGVPLWRSASDAVAEAVAAHQDSLTVGAVFFPTAGDIGALCTEGSVAPIDTPPQIDFQPAAGFLAAWAERWSTAGLVLTTPTERAMVVGEAALEQAGLPGSTAVILVTDGVSTCLLSRPAENEAVAQAWSDQGIPTYVVGLAGAAAQIELEAIANAGGTDRVFAPTDSEALTQELGRVLSTLVRSSLASCTIAFDEVPDSLQEIDLVVTESASGQRFRVPQGPDGWRALPDDRGAELQGKACTDALNGRFSSVSFEFGCESIPLI